jgi:hypothetical protein
MIHFHCRDESEQQADERNKEDITKTCSMLARSFFCWAYMRLFRSLDDRFCNSMPTSERNRRNLTLLSSNSILAVVTTSLFSSVFAFSSLSLSLILSVITTERIAYAIE